MARRIITTDERKERLGVHLDKAREALHIAESRLSAIETEREKALAKVKEKKLEVEKYEALSKESQYSTLDEMLRLKGVNVEEITKAIANGDTEYLLKLADLKAGDVDSDTDGGASAGQEEQLQAVPADAGEPAIPSIDKTNFTDLPGSAPAAIAAVSQQLSRNPYVTNPGALQNGQGGNGTDTAGRQWNYTRPPSANQP